MPAFAWTKGGSTHCCLLGGLCAARFLILKLNQEKPLGLHFLVALPLFSVLFLYSFLWSGRNEHRCFHDTSSETIGMKNEIHQFNELLG